MNVDASARRFRNLHNRNIYVMLCTSDIGSVFYKHLIWAFCGCVYYVRNAIFTLLKKIGQCRIAVDFYENWSRFVKRAKPPINHRASVWSLLNPFVCRVSPWGRGCCVRWRQLSHHHHHKDHLDNHKHQMEGTLLIVHTTVFARGIPILSFGKKRMYYEHGFLVVEKINLH